VSAAVLLTVGAARWNELSDTYFLLVKDPQVLTLLYRYAVIDVTIVLQVKVRRTLSCSLHEVARILGPEVTQSTLLPTFEAFLKDLEEVSTLCSFPFHISLIISPLYRSPFTSSHNTFHCCIAHLSIHYIS
jgi:hypothetical protein